MTIRQIIEIILVSKDGEKIMKNKINLLIVSMIFLSFGFATGQSLKEVILSNKVDRVIDNTERNKFQLFPKIRGFYEARFYLDSSKGYYARIRYINDDDINKDTVIFYRENEIIRFAEHIQFFDEIKSGKHFFGEISSLVKVQGNTVYIILNEVLNNQLRKVKKDPAELPFVRLNSPGYKIKKDKWDYNFGLGFSLANVNADFSPINSFFNDAENQLISQGFYVHKSNLNMNISTLMTFNASVKIYEKLGLFVDVGINSQKDFDYYYGSLDLQYRFNIKSMKWFSPNIALGYSYIGYFVARGYGDYNTSGSEYLDTIKSEGGSTGIIFNAGFDISLLDFSETSFLVLNVFTRYALMKEQESKYDGYTTTLKLSSFFAGAGFKIYF